MAYVEMKEKRGDVIGEPRIDRGFWTLDSGPWTLDS